MRVVDTSQACHALLLPASHSLKEVIHTHAVLKLEWLCLEWGVLKAGISGPREKPSQLSSSKAGTLVPDSNPCPPCNP